MTGSWLARLRARVTDAVERRAAPWRERLWWNSSSGRAMRERLAGLRGSLAGRRCWVLANGPSLLKVDVRRLKDEITIGSNALFLVYDKLGFAPTFLTVEDRLVAEDRGSTLGGLTTSTKIFPHDLAYCLGADDRTIYCNFLRAYPGVPRFSAEFEQVVYWGGTVSFLNLQLAYHLGCNPIYLVGFDHNYQVPKNLEGLVITSDRDDVNHVHPDYFGKGFRWHDPNVERMERAYQVARTAIEAGGVTVANATAGGHLEVFRRVDFDAVIRGDAA